MKLLGSTKDNITNNKNHENVPHLEINELVLVHLILSLMIINNIQESCIHLLKINHLDSYYIITLRHLI